MGDTHSRGFVLAARRMFWSGIPLFGLGLAVAWVADGRLVTWECESTVCRRTTSAGWEAIQIGALTTLVLGVALTAAGFLMITLRRPRSGSS
ncbi:hypothetical protein [Streptomyces sp. IB2014 016-6]|uniref:hypothetical protein n=1 Tax=Streptomyces sp. IB2014 016-6 TaxID=2517818 RepID=UPI0011D6AB63|nr:hypothetical protein [Streptomyces sp. IB2014 016-6]TXL89320.1 hypothetical protein EW053_15280 [Streptomyces sp. IB2014 016-6]